MTARTEVRFEWAAEACLNPPYVYPQPTEEAAHALVAFYAEHYPEKPLRVVRRTITISPWEPASVSEETR